MARATKKKQPQEPQETVMAAAPEGKVHRLRRMTDDQFSKEWERLTATYGNSRKEAGQFYEREISDFFYKSHWSLHEIANKVGKSRGFVVSCLRFGRFLQGSGEFRSTITRAYFERLYQALAGTTPDEQQRFSKVMEILTERKGLPKPSNAVTATLARKFRGDVGWHSMEAFVKASGAEEPQVLSNLVNLKYPGGVRPTRAEEKTIRGKRMFRLLRNETAARPAKSHLVSRLDIAIGMLSGKRACAEALEIIKEVRRALA